MQQKQDLNLQAEIFSDEYKTIPYDSELYPEAFRILPDAPKTLYCLGEPAWLLGAPSVAIVGSRKMTTDTGLWLQTEVFDYLNQVRPLVVSGGARGVDQMAHLQSMRAGLPTIVVLPSGLKNFYPKELHQIKDSVLSMGGCFLSEYLPEEPMKAYHFVQRNRLISALADFVLVAQAELRSGSLLTAKWALNQGKTLAAPPAHPIQMLYSGNISLLRNGAELAADCKDLISIHHRVITRGATF